MVMVSPVTPGPVAPPLLGTGAPGVPGTQGGAHQARAGSNSRPPEQWVVSPAAAAPGGVAPPAPARPAPPVAPATAPGPATPPAPVADSTPGPWATPSPAPAVPAALPVLETASPFCAVEGAVTMITSWTA